MSLAWKVGQVKIKMESTTPKEFTLSLVLIPQQKRVRFKTSNRWYYPFPGHLFKKKLFKVKTAKSLTVKTTAKNFDWGLCLHHSATKRHCGGVTFDGSSPTRADGASSSWGRKQLSLCRASKTKLYLKPGAHGAAKGTTPSGVSTGPHQRCDTEDGQTKNHPGATESGH